MLQQLESLEKKYVHAQNVLPKLDYEKTQKIGIDQPCIMSLSQ